MKNVLKFLLPLAVLLVVSCTNDSESDLLLVEEEVIDPEIPLTYNDDIQVIINNNCLACHSDPPAGAPFPLATYDQVLVRAENGQLLGAISRDAGDPRIMPPSGRLPQSVINTIQQWIEQGAIEE